MRFVREFIHVLDVQHFDWHIKEDAHNGQVLELDRSGVDFVEAEVTAVDIYGIQGDMKTVRLQFEVPDDSLEALDKLMEDSGTRTRTELFNNAMTLLKWAIKQRQEGRTIASINYANSNFREFEMPVLERAEEIAKARKTDPTSTSN